MVTPPPGEEWPKDYAICEKLPPQAGDAHATARAVNAEILIHERVRASTREANARAKVLNADRPKGSRVFLVRESKLEEYQVVSAEELAHRAATTARSESALRALAMPTDDGGSLEGSYLNLREKSLQPSEVRPCLRQ